MSDKEYQRNKPITEEKRNCGACGRRLHPSEQCFILGEVFCRKCARAEREED